MLNPGHRRRIIVVPSISFSLLDDPIWLNENLCVGIPAIQVADSESQYDLINYPIIANQRSVAFSYFLIYLVAETSTNALMNERLLFFNYRVKISSKKLLKKKLSTEAKISLWKKVVKTNYKDDIDYLQVEYDYRLYTDLLLNIGRLYVLGTNPKIVKEIGNIKIGFNSGKERYYLKKHHSYLKKKYVLYSLKKYQRKRQNKLYNRSQYIPRRLIRQKKKEFRWLKRRKLRWLKKLKRRKLRWLKKLKRRKLRWLKKLKSKKGLKKKYHNKKIMKLFRNQLKATFKFEIPQIYKRIHYKNIKNIDINYYKILEAFIYKKFRSIFACYKTLQKIIHRKKKWRIRFYRKKKTRRQYKLRKRFLKLFHKIIEKFLVIFVQLLTRGEIRYRKRKKKHRFITTIKLKKTEISSKFILLLAQYYRFRKNLKKKKFIYLKT